jgi:hypothetical protein
MERIVSFEPAHHKGVVNGADYGVGPVRIRFVLKGELGAVQLLLGTNWYLPEDQKRFTERGMLRSHGTEPTGWDLGYHSPTPMYEGQETMGPCEWLDGKPCYYDGSGLAADAIRNRLLAEGDAGVWAALTDCFRNTFGEVR